MSIMLRSSPLGCCFYHFLYHWTTGKCLRSLLLTTSFHWGTANRKHKANTIYTPHYCIQKTRTCIYIYIYTLDVSNICIWLYQINIVKYISIHQTTPLLEHCLHQATMNFASPPWWRPCSLCGLRTFRLAKPCGNPWDPWYVINPKDPWDWYIYHYLPTWMVDLHDKCRSIYRLVLFSLGLE